MGIMKKLGFDTAVLSFVRVMTMLVNVIQTMVLSRTLTKNQYGTYSQVLLVLQFFIVFFSLGLENAVNYFYNSVSNVKKRNIYINTVFSLSFLGGLTALSFLLLFSRPIALGFANSQMTTLIIIVSLRPLLQNLITLYQPLFISCGDAKLIALMNLGISILQVSVVSGLSIGYKDLGLIFGVLIFLDILQLVCFSGIFKKRYNKISYINVKKKKIND